MWNLNCCSGGGTKEEYYKQVNFNFKEYILLFLLFLITFPAIIIFIIISYLINLFKKWESITIVRSVSVSQ